MRDDLRSLNLLPLIEPYTAIPHFTHYGNGGGESVEASFFEDKGENSIVDWLLIEVRDENDPSTIVETQSVLLQRDGTVVDINGNSQISFDLSGESYFIAIRHRNHLGIMSQNSVIFDENMVLNFTDVNTQTWGNNACIDLENGQQAMWGGNSNIDDKIIFQGTDSEVTNQFFSILAAPNNETSIINYILEGYDNGDVDMNGQCIFSGQDNEPNLIFFNVLSHPSNSSFVNFIITEQLPD